MLDLPSPALIGVVHLPPLAGSPSHVLTMEAIVERACSDARALAEAGFDAIFVENFGDMPFAATTLSPASLGAMAVAADRVRREVSLPLGINALRNDALAALGIASASGARFVRVNVHTGVCATDQGLLTGRADETLRYRKLLGQRIAILADVHVKHATPISEPQIELAARSCAYRGLADGLIVTGPETGEPVDLDQLRSVRNAVPDRRLFVGSGATVDTVASLLSVATGVIVGTGIKVESITTNPVDPARAREFVRAAGRA